MRRLSFFAVATIAALAAVGCGGTAATNAPAASGDTGSSAPTGASAPASAPASSAAAACATAPVPADADVTVDIKDFKFSPDPVTAKVGDVIAWTNSDSPSHTASLTDGSCGTEQLATGITGALVFTVPGTYTYQCNIHPGQMKGYTITITQ